MRPQEMEMKVSASTNLRFVKSTNKLLASQEVGTKQRLWDVSQR